MRQMRLEKRAPARQHEFDFWHFLWMYDRTLSQTWQNSRKKLRAHQEELFNCRDCSQCITANHDHMQHYSFLNIVNTLIQSKPIIDGPQSRWIAHKTNKNSSRRKWECSLKTPHNMHILLCNHQCHYCQLEHIIVCPAKWTDVFLK